MAKSIVVGICTGGSIRAETVSSLIAALTYNSNKGLISNLLMQIGGYVDVNRNAIVDTALKDKADYVMFIDADMGFPPEGILTLINDDKDIVGADYNVRLDPTAVIRSGPTTKMVVDNQLVSMLREDFPTDLFKCGAVATGFLLIKTSVFKKLERPYFDARIDKNGIHYTEDVDFCIKAREAGIDIWCDPAISMQHIGNAVY